MARIKTKTAYLCSACGDDYPKWNGQCPSCKEWGTLSEFKISAKKNGRDHKPRETKSFKEVLTADEAFVTGTFSNIVPVKKINNKKFSISKNNLTSQLRELYLKKINQIVNS